MPWALVETNGSNRWSTTSLARPGPLSATAISMVSSSSNAVLTVSSRRPRPCHRLERVAHQVDEDLLDLDPIGERPRGVRVEAKTRLDAERAAPDQCKSACLLDHRDDVLDAFLGLTAARRNRATDG